jgi:hypothetical protein
VSGSGRQVAPAAKQPFPAEARPLVSRSFARGTLQTDKSFLLLFFKKAALPYLAARPNLTCPLEEIAAPSAIVSCLPPPAP